MDAQKLIRRSRLFLKRNSATILTCVGAAGVVVTTVSAVKATPKAMALLEVARGEKGEDLTKWEIVKTAGPVYIPAIIFGASTITCIFGANVLNKRQQAALASAYALLNKTHNIYKEKVNDLYGEEADQNVRTEIAKDRYEDEPPVTLGEDEELYYDEFGERYFNATPYKVQFAEYRLNRDIQTQGWSTLNDFYESIGIEPIDGGDALGWSEGGNYAKYWQSWVDFNHHKVVMDDGLECTILSFFEEPYHDYEMYA